MTLAEARVKFRQCVAKVGGQQAAANLLGCTKAHVCHIFNEQRNVGFRLAVAIEEEKNFRIPAKVWTPEKRQRRRRRR